MNQIATEETTSEAAVMTKQTGTETQIGQEVLETITSIRTTTIDLTITSDRDGETLSIVTSQMRIQVSITETLTIGQTGITIIAAYRLQSPNNFVTR